MKLVEPSVLFVSGIADASHTLQKLENAGRICWHSGESQSEETAEAFIRRIIKMGHESVLEHHCITLRVTCSRACAQQWTRHRIASYSMQSQRYVDFLAAKHGSGSIAFVMPEGATGEAARIMCEQFSAAEAAYAHLRQAGVPAEDARVVLPAAAATEFYCTMNLRELRLFIKLRTDIKAQKEIRTLAKQVHAGLMGVLPCVFDDLKFQ